MEINEIRIEFGSNGWKKTLYLLCLTGFFLSFHPRSKIVHDDRVHCTPKNENAKQQP